MSAPLTRTQRAALAALRETGAQWPLRQGVHGSQREHCRQWSFRTLHALVQAGYAEWVTRPRVLLHVIPTDKES